MINGAHLPSWLALADNSKLNVFQQTATQIGLPANAVEKDWWVVHTLQAIFSLECAAHLVFKGGTSLSKGWKLIERFSEDIDLVLDKKYLGFAEELNKQEIKKLRRASFDFITTQFAPQLQHVFSSAEFSAVLVKCREVENHDHDPLIIEIYYPKLTDTDSYLKPGVLVEVGVRSLKEPFTNCTFNTIVADNYNAQTFADVPITVPIVNPERTFLEKIFLLHEEFQKPTDKIRIDRLSRHLYDIEKLSQTKYATIALQNAHLYQTILQHRKMFTPVSGVDYENHQPQKIQFIPPQHLLPIWEADYKQMRENMIHETDALTFKVLIEKLLLVQQKINALNWR